MTSEAASELSYDHMSMKQLRIMRGDTIYAEKCNNYKHDPCKIIEKFDNVANYVK